MIRKPKTLRLFCAVVLCFAAVSAFRPGNIRQPSPLDLPDASDRISMLPEHPLTPFQEALNHPRKLTPLLPNFVDSETLWLARAIFSETKRPEEQILIAWVIRNRVETGFRGKVTYEDVVLDPYQFSAFMSSSEDLPFYLSLMASSTVPGWQRTLHIAYNIRQVGDNYRPFSEETRHFYSERSMKDNQRPEWIEGQNAIDIAPIVHIDERRFRFYEGIS